MKRENTDSVGRRAVFSFFFFVSSQPGWSVSLCKCTVFSVEDGERLDTLICIAIIPREKKKKRYILLKCAFVEWVFCQGTSR